MNDRDLSNPEPEPRYFRTSSTPFRKTNQAELLVRYSIFTFGSRIQRSWASSCPNHDNHLADAKMGVLASITDVTHLFDWFPAERANISRRAWEAPQRVGTRYDEIGTMYLGLRR